MPKTPKKEVKDPKTHWYAVKDLLVLIAERAGKARGDVVIAYEEDISVYAVRQWLSRPIPRKHWKIIAKLSGLTMDQIEKIAL